MVVDISWKNVFDFMVNIKGFHPHSIPTNQRAFDRWFTDLFNRDKALYQELVGFYQGIDSEINILLENRRVA